METTKATSARAATVSPSTTSDVHAADEKRKHTNDDVDGDDNEDHDETVQTMERSSAKAAIQKIVLRDLWSDDEAVLKRAMGQLQCLTNPGDDDKHTEAQADLFQVGGHLAVVMAMKKRFDDSSFQECAIKILVNVTYKNMELKLAIAAVEGMEAVVQALHHFPNNESIVVNGLKALSNLCACRTNCKRLIGKMDDGIPTLLSSLESFQQNEDVVLWGCRLMKKLIVGTEESCEPLFQANALSILGGIVERHEDNDKDIKKLACSVMARLVQYVLTRN